MTVYEPRHYQGIIIYIQIGNVRIFTHSILILAGVYYITVLYYYDAVVNVVVTFMRLLQKWIVMKRQNLSSYPLDWHAGAICTVGLVLNFHHVAWIFS